MNQKSYWDIFEHSGSVMDYLDYKTYERSQALSKHEEQETQKKEATDRWETVIYGTSNNSNRNCTVGNAY